MTKNKFYREKTKVLMATWDDSEASEDEEEQASMTLMDNSKESDSRSKSDLDPN